MYRRTEAVALVAVGGFTGANLRYAVDLAAGSGLVATLAVNVVGSLLLGVVLYEAIEVGRGSERARLALATGFLSSFTTYSAFVVEAVRVDPAVAGGFVVASYATGFGAVLVGGALVRRFVEGSP